VKLDGVQCRASAIRGQTKCLFHIEYDARKEALERPLSLDEKISILSREIRSAQKIKNRAQRSYEIRCLMVLLNQLQSGGNSQGENAQESGFDRRLEQWKKSKVQT